MRLLRAMRDRLRDRRRRRKEAMGVMANNREAESRLWAEVARGRPAGSEGRSEARGKSSERAAEARRLREGEAALLRSLGIGGGR